VSRNSSIILLGFILGLMILPVASIYAWQRSQLLPEEISTKKAIDYLYDSPTFSFDGIVSSVKVVGVMPTTTFIPQSMIVTIEFDCSHGGYGDRNGQNILQIIHHHTAVIHITEGLVTKMVIDGVWDELAGQMI
jgi:hypothetical protein